jgi:hypothetical protein
VDFSGRPAQAFNPHPPDDALICGARTAIHLEELALPISAESGNLGLNKAVIRWMSDNANRT